MKSILFVGIIAIMSIAATAGFGFTNTSAQMEDNVTMGNMSGGNMTMGTTNMTSGNYPGAGSISSTGGPGF